jgi:hypothetical protein
MAKKTHEKLFTIPGHKGNTNQNHTKIPLHSFRIVSIKIPPTTNVGEDMGKKEPSHTAGGNVS